MGIQQGEIVVTPGSGGQRRTRAGTEAAKSRGLCIKQSREKRGIRKQHHPVGEP